MCTKRRELNVPRHARHAEDDHFKRNSRTCLEISSQVGGWLKEVEKIDEEVKKVPSDVDACCSLKIRHTVGREAFKLIEEIESAIRQHCLITWSDQSVPSGKVDTMKAYHMIALCGMDGVGNTTMMKRLNKFSKENRMFSYMVEAVIGEKMDPLFNVGLLIEAEAQSFFQQFAKTSEPTLHKIGEDIVRKCCGLPIAIKTMTDSCKTISLTCKSMHEFPLDLKFPNLTILKIMHGDKSLRFPQDFYEGMEKLQVISYDRKYPMLPSSPQCSINLRVLHLHECSLKMFDCSCIGNLSNVEVISFANSGIEWLPSTIGNLKKLRLLDLTDCHGLHIKQGIFKNLVKLEELYMGFSDRPRSRGNINMTYVSYNELAEHLKDLSALEFQFFENNAEPKNMLKLVTNKDELLGSRMNELFVETEMLCLSVDDMNDLGDVCVDSSRSLQPSTFKNLRVFVVSKCAELRYLFTIGVAKDLSNLEHLEVDSCNNMEQLICTENAGKETIKFLKLKFLSLSHSTFHGHLSA